MLLSHKKEWSTDTGYNLDDPWEHNAKWKKPVTEDHLLYDNLFERSRVGKSIETESRLVVARGWENERNGEWRMVAQLCKYTC